MALPNKTKSQPRLQQKSIKANKVAKSQSRCKGQREVTLNIRNLSSDASTKIESSSAPPIKVEEGASPLHPLIIDPIPALKDPGKRRGYATMVNIEPLSSRLMELKHLQTALEKLKHDFQVINTKEARQRDISSGMSSPARNGDRASDDEEMHDAEGEDVRDDSWIDYDNTSHYTWPYDNSTTHDDRERARTVSPSPSSPATISKARLRVFERTFSSIVFGMGYEDISQVTKTVNSWLEGLVPFRMCEATLALRAMEGKGLVKFCGGKVYLPEAFGLVGRMVGVKIERV